MKGDISNTQRCFEDQVKIVIFVLLNSPSHQRYRTDSALDILQAMLAMLQSKSNRFDLANFMKARKDVRQKAIEQSKVEHN